MYSLKTEVEGRKKTEEEEEEKKEEGRGKRRERRGTGREKNKGVIAQKGVILLLHYFSFIARGQNTKKTSKS